MCLKFDLLTHSQRLPEAQGEGEGDFAVRVEEQRERFAVSCAAEDRALWPGVPPQWTDQR